MPTPRQTHRLTTRLLSTVMIVIGLVLIGITLANGGTVWAQGVIVGVLFVLAGAGRLVISLKGI